MQSAKKQMTFNRPRNELFLGDDTCLTLGASHNMSPLNNRCIVVNCRKRFNKQQKAIALLDRCGNHSHAVAICHRVACIRKRAKPLHLTCGGVLPINTMVLGKSGGNGDRQTFGIGDDGDPCPTLQCNHSHAVAVLRRRRR